MKRCFSIIVLSLGLTASATGETSPAPNFIPPPLPPEVVQAQKDTPIPQQPPPDPAQLQSQYEALEAFLRLPPERLRKMRETLQRLEQMTPDEREKLHQRIQELRKARQSIFGDLQRYQNMLAQEDRESFARNWFRLDPIERQKFRQLEQSLSPEAFREYLKSKAR